MHPLQLTITKHFLSLTEEQMHLAKTLLSAVRDGNQESLEYKAAVKLINAEPRTKPADYTWDQMTLLGSLLRAFRDDAINSDDGEEVYKAKLATLLLDLTGQQRDWLRDLKAVNWENVDPKEEAKHRFTDAFFCSIRHSVAYPILNTLLTEAGVLTKEGGPGKITAHELNKIAAGIYKR